MYTEFINAVASGEKKVMGLKRQQQELQSHLYVTFLLKNNTEQNVKELFSLSKQMFLFILFLCVLGSGRPIIWRRQWHPTPVLLPMDGKSYGWSSLVDCSPWGH